MTQDARDDAEHGETWAPSFPSLAREGEPRFARDRLQRGDKVAHFIVEEVIGEGGMGIVVAARDPELDRKVAIKILRPGKSSDSDGARRLLREAQAMARLSHPNVVAVHEVGKSGEQVFIAMEYVEGDTLREWLAGEHDWREIVAVMIAAGRGLAAAHAAGLVHRDFKPDNVLIGRDGRVRVADFGLASTSAADASAALEKAASDGTLSLAHTVTHVGLLVGTPLFMAPEQHQRKPVTFATDQFAFALVLYHALYRRRPFAGSDYDTLADNVISGRAQAPGADGVPAWVGEVIMRALEVDAERRYASIETLLAALAHDPRAARRRRWSMVILAAAMTALVVIVVSTFAGQGGDHGRCTRASRQLAGVWDKAVAESMRASFLATDKPYAADTYARTAATLDEFSRAWRAMWRESCVATHEQRRQDGATFDLRMRCLDRQRGKLAALTRRFVAADADTLDRAVAAVRGLPAISRCADVAALSAAIPPPEDAAVRARVAELGALLDSAEADAAAGHSAQALEVAREVVARARKVDYPPLLAEALRLQGNLSSYTGELLAARAILEEATRVAAAARNDELVADSWLDLMNLISTDLGRPDAALALRASAEAAIARAGETPALHARLLYAVGRASHDRGDFAIAEGAFLEFLALIESNPAAVDDPAMVRNALGLTYQAQGRNDEAEAQFERVLARYSATLGEDHPELATPLNNLAMVASVRGEPRRAQAYLERSLRLEKQRAPESVGVVIAMTNLGDALLEQGKLAEACAQLEKALELGVKIGGSDHPNLAYPLTSLGRCLIESAQASAAIDHLERALGFREANPGDPHLLADTRFALARALVAGAGDRQRARKLADQAHAARAGDSWAAARAEIEEWLRATYD